MAQEDYFKSSYAVYYLNEFAFICSFFWVGPSFAKVASLKMN